MTSSDTDKAREDRIAQARYQAAVAAAIVAGAFSLAVCGFLAARHIRTTTLELQKSEELAGLREALLKAPNESARRPLQEAIRVRDLELRQDFFRRQAFSKTGGCLLAAGVVVFLVAASRAVACRRRLPTPRLDLDAPRKAARAARLARWSVAALGGAIGAVAILLVALSINPLNGEGTEPDEGQAAETGPSPEELHKQWPRFRGPDGLGVSAYTNVPASWNGKTGEGILWKTPVPLPGENSPVVWGNRVFLCGADDKKREVYCFDTEAGKLLWQKSVTTAAGSAAEPPEVLEDTGFAAPTMVTSGRWACAIFANGDIACFDFEGKQLWARHLGPFSNNYGHASSLAMYRNLVLVLADQGTPGKPKGVLLGLDGRSGKTLWEVKRPVPSSWATPIVASTGKRDELITCGKPWVIAYDPAAGAELWRAKVLDGDVAPSPVYAGGFVFAVNTGARLAALRAGGQGDVTDSAVAWSAEDGLPDIVSPLANGQFVLTVTTDGVLTLYRATDGSKVLEKEIDAVFKSSPTLAGNRIYLMNEKGAMYILSADEKLQELGKAELGEPAHCSPAFLDGRIYIRGKTHLYCIGKK